MALDLVIESNQVRQIGLCDDYLIIKNLRENNTYETFRIKINDINNIKGTNWNDFNGYSLKINNGSLKVKVKSDESFWPKLIFRIDSISDYL